MSTTYYFEQQHDQIILKVREYEGVGQAQHSVVDRVTIAYAKGMLDELGKSISSAEKYSNEMATRREKDLEKEIAQKQSELDGLRKKREYEQNKNLGIEPDDDYTPI